MFGITDAADSDSGSGESADISSDIEISTVHQKRDFSSGTMESCAKQPKLDENHMSYGLNGRNKLRSPSKRFQARITQQALKMFYSERYRRNMKHTTLNSDGRPSDSESSSDRLSVQGYFSPHLKEVRVSLQDIKYNRKYQDMVNKTTSSQRKLWEVEKIIQKREQNGKSSYLIKWKGWETQYNTWEPACNLTNCKDLLCEFEEEQQRMIKLFKTKANFYPNIPDVEKFLAKSRRPGISIDNLLIEEDSSAITTDILKFVKNVKNKSLKIIIKERILRMLLSDLRHDQLEALKEWEDEMNNITNGKPTIRIENLVDLESAPQDFYYINDYLPGAGVVIPDDPPIGCECRTCGPNSNCCFAQNAGSLPYTSTGRVRVPPGTPIYECNKRCTCDMNCPNRVVQRGTDVELCIFRTDDGRGWGVKTLRAIKRGTFVVQYVGEVINSEEAEKRGKQYDVTGRTYLFDLDYNETDGPCPFTVDAATYGNTAHFINHSCDPNLAVYVIWINCLDPNLPNLALFAIKDIKRNEELTFDYMCQTLKGNENMKQQLNDQLNDSVPENKTLCKCGAEKCRRYLF